jgi:hypothetical protein
MALGAESAWSSSTIQALMLRVGQQKTPTRGVCCLKQTEVRVSRPDLRLVARTEGQSDATDCRRDCVSLGFLPILTSLRDRTHCVRASNDMPLACR